MNKSRGFTLIELMVVVVVLAMLAVLALPSYLSQVRKSRRSQVEGAIQQVAMFAERYRADCTTYATFGSTCTGTGAVMPSWSTIYSQSYYGTPTFSNLSGSTYTISVAANSTANQNRDKASGTSCATLYYAYGADTSVDTACSLTSTAVTASGKVTKCPLNCWAN